MKEKILAVIKNLIWKKLRYKKIIQTHKKVAKSWEPIIKRYENEDIEKYSFNPKFEFKDNKIIWQYWGQGFDDANIPDIVRICTQSVDRYCDDYIIVRLNDDTIEKYIDLPDFVKEKRRNPKFTRTFFSDLLRLLLLNTYGGIWLDATILLTNTIPLEYRNYDFFMYQRWNDERDKSFWENSYAYYWGWSDKYKVRLLNSIIYSKKGCKEIKVLLDIMLYFWRYENNIPDYFFFQILFNELIGKKIINNCPIVSDCIPHYLQAKINGNYKWLSFDEILNITSIHKMTYFKEDGIIKLKKVLGI